MLEVGVLLSWPAIEWNQKHPFIEDGRMPGVHYLFAVYVYFYELRPPVGSRYLQSFALLLFCFHTPSLACFQTSVWPYFYSVS